jgi:hypothetical protein
LEEKKNCVLRRLAGRASFSADACVCGAIHLTIGFITLRVDPCAFREFAAVVMESLRHLEAPDCPTIH